MDFLKSCVNSSVALKQQYLGSLKRHREMWYTKEATSLNSSDFYSHSQTYQQVKQYIINDTNRKSRGFSTNLYEASEYDKLGLSLISPLVNEQDFAINVCALMSCEAVKPFHLKKHPRILHYLLAHAAVFSHSNLETLFVENYLKHRGFDIRRFWDDVSFGSKLEGLIRRILFKSELNECACCSDILMCSLETSNLFCSLNLLVKENILKQRILQIATILINLTFTKENLFLMIKDITFLKFVLMCYGCHWNVVHQLGWDMLSNISSELTETSAFMPIVLEIVLTALNSSDLAEIISSLEILNTISQNITNKNYILKNLNQEVYEKIYSYLFINDVFLLISTLECMYSLSLLGECPCNALLKIHGIIGTLVSLLTVEGNHYNGRKVKIIDVMHGMFVSSGLNIADPATSTSCSIEQINLKLPFVPQDQNETSKDNSTSMIEISTVENKIVLNNVTPPNQYHLVMEQKLVVTSSENSNIFVISPSRTGFSASSVVNPNSILPEGHQIVTPKIVLSIYPHQLFSSPVPVTLYANNSPSSNKTSTTSEKNCQTTSIKKKCFSCDWKNCSRPFKSSNAVYLHACKEHCPQSSEEVRCLWKNCTSQLKRQKFSHMTHLGEHISDLKVSESEELPGNLKTHGLKPIGHQFATLTPHKVINLHRGNIHQDCQSNSEEPVTKSIRLTAALVLRNLVTSSASAQKFLIPYEYHLANLAASDVESSSTIAQVLHELTNPLT